jgi:tryptophanyl-tRNA synthetase
VQSHVVAHAECCWLLNCVTPIGWLQRMTQFKDKSAKQESVLTGLLDYPVLMAGDIFLYDANEVPVGDDQKQHVELARDIAQRFNSLYGQEFFVIPEPKIPTVAARVMGLDDPSNKMSKSSAHIRGHAVRLEDDDKEIMRSFKKAKTDSFNEIRFSDEPERAGVNNLLGIYQAITGKMQAEVEADFADARGYGDLKVRVGEVTIAEVAPVRERYQYLMQDPAELDRLLAIGAEQATAVAAPKLKQMKEIMGLVLPK